MPGLNNRWAARRPAEEGPVPLVRPELELRLARAETLPPVQPPDGAVKPQEVTADLGTLSLMCT